MRSASMSGGWSAAELLYLFRRRQRSLRPLSRYRNGRCKHGEGDGLFEGCTLRESRGERPDEGISGSRSVHDLDLRGGEVLSCSFGCYDRTLRP